MGLLEIAIVAVGWFAFATLIVACATAAGRADRRERRLTAEAADAPAPASAPQRERRRFVRTGTYYAGPQRRVRSGMRTVPH